MSENKKELEIINGDGSNLNISHVYDHLNTTKPKSSDEKPKNIVIPKEQKNTEKKKRGAKMENRRNVNLSTERLVMMAMLTALTAVLAYFGGFIKIGGLASISLTLIPVVIGSALLGPFAGAWLGGIAGAVFFLTADSAFWLGLSIPGTIITVMVKGILSGLCAGFAYKLLKKNAKIAMLMAAVVCPVVNTGIFLLGCLVFFMDAVKGMATAEGISIGAYLILFFVGLNFVFELLANIILSPAILRIINIRKKN